LRRFIVTTVNDNWLHKRFAEWSIGRTGENLQLRSASEAEDFLSTFDSPHSGEFWSESYSNSIKKILPESPFANINVWNIGCGKGYETYSFACILKNKYPNARLKIWANDNDIMAVSQAPNMIYDLDDIPEYCRHYMVHGQNGYSFNPAIKDSIVFEYHDVLNENTLPDMDIILVRDVLSFLPAQEQTRIIADFSEKLKTRGFVIIGRNEELTGANWQAVANDPVSAFSHN
jgi:purine-binding chemotaxis protein CheW